MQLAQVRRDKEPAIDSPGLRAGRVAARPRKGNCSPARPPASSSGRPPTRTWRPWPNRSGASAARWNGCRACCASTASNPKTTQHDRPPDRPHREHNPLEPSPRLPTSGEVAVIPLAVGLPIQVRRFSHVKRATTQLQRVMSGGAVRTVDRARDRRLPRTEGRAPPVGHTWYRRVTRPARARPAGHPAGAGSLARTAG